MSQVKLNLQPPPNVDFVTGYPGIPPGPDRPQASVKGAIEVRVPPQGVKAKWVRIELRKVETLPGGGPANTFYDFVGPSPVSLWSTSDEYSLLRSQDFPFSIRIPESTPPTIALDNRAGIGYELVASVCTKGKRGFLRKAKSVVVSSVAPIIIDKHDLHSTWPVYCQKEMRSVSQEEVTLHVERHNQCYGPGDRVAVTAIVKSDSLHTVILRGFEFSLRETIVFRHGVHGAGKKHAPQTRQTNIGENKIMVNSTLYGGTSHTAELACMISPNHTTTSLQAARHIDIDYVLCIKAIMGTGAHLVMELPVVISNWQRHVSFEAINRIGPAPNLSLLPPPGTSAITRVDPVRPAGAATTAASSTLPLSRSNVESAYTRSTSAGPFNTLPAGGALTGSSHIDEFGSTTSRPTTANAPATASLSSAAPTASTASASNRFQPQNIQPQEQEISRQRSAQATGSGSGSGSSGAPAQQQWPTAEDEKLRLFEQARVKVAQVQGVAAAPPPASLRSSPPPQNISPARVAATPASPGPAKTEWLSAEEEKRRFQQAQAAVARTQGVAPQVGTPTHTRDTSDPKPQSSGSGSGAKPSAAAQLYAEAIKARSAGNANNLPSAKPPGSNSYATAEQEKAALKRYHEAKRAVEVTQNSAVAGVASSPPSGSAPIAYESLFPAASAPTAPPPPADSPPPFNTAAGPSNIMAHLSEKERLRRKYEEQDAAAARNNASAPPPAAYTSPPPTSVAPVPPPAGPGPLPNQYANALEEKEALRRKFEARDNAQARATPNPQTPARANTATVTPTKNEGGSVPVRSPSANLPSVRPAPTPPANARVLTAAEEKALLRAKYEARDGGMRKPPVNVTVAPVNGNHNLPNPNGTSASTPTTPPPLLPRPPADYIKATQEEDARLSRINGVAPNLDGYATSSSSSSKPPSGASALDMKPFTPFQAGFDSSSTAPPLPLSRPNGD